MSYADAAAKGPKQTPEEVRIPEQVSFVNVAAPQLPSVSHTESETASLIDVDAPHVNTVSSNFEEQTIKTDTQFERIEREYEDKTRAEIHRVEEASRDAKAKASEKAKLAKAKAKKEGQKFKENSDNPVYVANTLIWSIGAVALGVAAYQKHSEGKLDGKLVGTVAGAVGAFAVVDYFASSWLLENKYPTQ